jgi:hypothetical protein
VKKYYGKQQVERKKEASGEGSKYGEVRTEMGFAQSTRHGKSSEEIGQAA